ELARRHGHRATLVVPLLREGAAIGAILLRRSEPKPFTDSEIALITSFAAQLVIAIENVRLLNELRESLQQQTATADVLKVISRSTCDLETVLDALVGWPAKLCGADKGFMFRFDGALLNMVPTHNVSPERKEFLTRTPLRPGRQTAASRAALEHRTIHIADVQADPEYSYRAYPDLSDGQRESDPYRTVLGVSMLRAGDLMGVIVLSMREVRPFTDKQIELVETFADQAVIAIENARLFEAEQQRTHELTEALEQQTATSEVLSVISSSPGELEPVF